MTRRWLGVGGRISAALLGAALVAACAAETDEAVEADAPLAAATPSGDIPAPDIFAATGEGLWDGRPSLGGIWVAHPDVDDAQRARIRNLANGEEITGALFRRERDNPGPVIQISSEAADMLGVLAGQPTEIDIVALRRGGDPEPTRDADAPEPATDDPFGGPVETEALPDPAAAPAPEPLARSLLQIGTFPAERPRGTDAADADGDVRSFVGPAAAEAPGR